MLVKCRTVKKIYGNESYSIFSCWLNEPNDNIVLSNWGNFTIKDTSNILSENKDYELNVKETEYRGSKQYILVNIPMYTINSIDDITEEREIEILKSITTDKQAEYVHEAYPNFVKFVLSGELDKIDINNIYNVGEVRLNAYIREINSKYKYYHIMNKFPEYELSAKDCKELCQEFETVEKVIEKLTNHPYYSLIEVCGKKFSSIDKIILKYNESFKESEERCEYAIIDVLKANELDGSTYMDANEMAEYINGLDECLLKYVKNATINSNKIHYIEKDKSVALLDTYMAEARMAQFIKDRLENSEKWDIDYEKYKETEDFKLTEEQLIPLKNLCEYNVSLLTGVAGSGKTSSVKAIIAMLEENGRTYLQLSPTGKAAKRLAESTNRPASTMHRAIGKFGGEFDFDVIIVDEFSFFGTEWTNMLINAITYPYTKVLFVGDNFQLNPISCGKTLQDLIDSGVVPTTKLTKVFRYGEGGISKIAEDLRTGKSNFTTEGLQNFGKDYTFINTTDVKDTILDTYVDLLNKGVKPQEITCISPFNVGNTGCYELNNELQGIINPIKPNEFCYNYEIKRNNKIYKVALHKGDYVMNIVNDYDALVYEDYMKMIEIGAQWDDMPFKTAVYNGDCGTIVSCDEDKIVVKFDDQLVVYTPNKIRNLILCMVVTTHKVQGSQNKYIINVSAPEHKRMLTRNLLYVANTRATYKHIEIGSPSVIESALTIEENRNRKTKLCELLKGDE